MKNLKIITALISILIITVLSVSALLSSQTPAGINYAPATGDSLTTIIIFVGLGIVAVGALIFISKRRK